MPSEEFIILFQFCRAATDSGMAFPIPQERKNILGYIHLSEFGVPHDIRMSERVNARLKDEFGGRTLRVRGASKIMEHLMFGILALTVDQLLRLAD
jgi:hypothetical protein